MTLRKVEMTTLATGACRYFLPPRPPTPNNDAGEESVDEG
jgi:hypothetical protein